MSAIIPQSRWRDVNIVVPLTTAGRLSTAETSTTCFRNRMAPRPWMNRF